MQESYQHMYKLKQIKLKADLRALFDIHVSKQIRLILQFWRLVRSLEAKLAASETAAVRS